MIITLEEAKLYLRVDANDDDSLITLQIKAAEEYLKNSTGKTFDDTNPIAKLLCMLYVQNLYDNRTYTVSLNEKTSLAAAGLLLQLKYSYTDEAES